MLRRLDRSTFGQSLVFLGSLGFFFLGKGAVAAEVSPAAKGAAESLTSLTQSQREAFQWFDGLGFPTLKDRQLVRVATGWWHQSGDDPPQNTYRLGFLLESEGDRFTVLLLDLGTATFTGTPPDTPEHQRVGYEKLDLKEQAAAYLKTARAVQAQSKTDPTVHFRHMVRFGPYLSEESEAFVLARACAAQGLEAQARELLDFSEEVCRQETRDDQPRTLRQAVAQRIAHKRMWEAVLSFGNPEISRKELLRQFEWLVQHCPESEHAPRARKAVELLREMVREDEAHANQTKPWEKMSTDERVAELIFRLRDQNGQQWSQPGRCDVFLDPRGEQSPAHQLVEMGFDAVPRLIDALDDHRFTRSVGYHRDFYFSHYVLRVGDCARAVLERIAGRDFYDRSSTSSEMSTDEAEKEVKRRIEGWWKEVQMKGEKQVLTEGVERADQNSPWQASRLLEKYPDDALAAIVRGARKADDAWVRRRLIEVAAQARGEAPVAFLLEEMKQAPHRACRVIAARGLLRRKHPDALPAMIAEWRSLPVGEDVRFFGDRGIEDLIALLAASRSAKAIRALAEDFDKRPVGVKLSIISAFGPGGNMGVMATGSGGSLISAGSQIDKDAVRAAVEELLVAALDDTERRIGMSATWGEKSFSDPRICDVAGHVLWMRWPDKYAFDIEASKTVRDRQRVELKNVWRKQHGLPPLELPKPPHIPRMSVEELRPHWDAILRASNEAEQKKAAARVEAHGLSALPAARKLLAAVAADAPWRPALEELVRRLSVMVREAGSEATAVPDEHPLAKALKAAEGRPLTADRFVQLLLAFTRQPPRQFTGITLSAERAGDDTGIVIRLTPALRKGSPSGRAGRQGGWETSERVSAGRKVLLASSGASAYDYRLNVSAYEDLAQALRTALSRPQDEPLEVLVTISRQE